MSYEGLDDEEKLETIPVIYSNNNNVNIVSDSNSDDIDNNIKNDNETFFDENIDDEFKRPLKLLSMPKWYKQWKSCKLPTTMMPTKSSTSWKRKKCHGKFKLSWSIWLW